MSHLREDDAAVRLVEGRPGWPDRTLTESRPARDQSSRPASPSSSRTLCFIRQNTPASAHSRIRRQHVQPEP